jgi:hypothetical protein
MRIQLAKRTQQRLGRKQYVPVTTSFVTEEGPAVGTIWFDREQLSVGPHIVKSVHTSDNRVWYQSDEWDRLSAFVDLVREGRYILIGTVAPATSFTVT